MAVQLTYVVSLLIMTGPYWYGWDAEFFYGAVLLSFKGDDDDDNDDFGE